MSHPNHPHSDLPAQQTALPAQRIRPLPVPPAQEIRRPLPAPPAQQTALPAQRIRPLPVPPAQQTALPAPLTNTPRVLYGANNPPPGLPGAHIQDFYGDHMRGLVGSNATTSQLRSQPDPTSAPQTPRAHPRIEDFYGDHMRGVVGANATSARQYQSHDARASSPAGTGPGVPVLERQQQHMDPQMHGGNFAPHFGPGSPNGDLRRAAVTALKNIWGPSSLLWSRKAVDTLLDQTRSDGAVLQLALYYLFEAKRRDEDQFCRLEAQRTFAVSFIVAHEVLLVLTYNSSAWSTITGFSIAEIDACEGAFLKLLGNAVTRRPGKTT